MFDYKWKFIQCWGDKYIDKEFESDRYIVIKIWKFKLFYQITTEHRAGWFRIGLELRQIRHWYHGSWELGIEFILGKWKITKYFGIDNDKE